MGEQVTLETASELDKIGHLLESKLEEAGADGYVVGISGGIDSAVAAAVAAETLGPDQVIGVRMGARPDATEDIQLAREVADAIGIDLYSSPIADLTEKYRRKRTVGNSKEVIGNVMARLRMTTLYAIANTGNFLVLGTGNKSEILTGYFTKYGDGAADVQPLAHLYKTEVYELAKELDLPQRVIDRPPSAGLWEGQRDEDELGLTYEQLDYILPFLENGAEPYTIANISKSFDDEPRVHKADIERILSLMEETEHKRRMPPTVEDI